MAEYKICSCGEKNSPTAIFCQRCQNDLMSVEITSESEEKSSKQEGEEALLNFDQLFSSAPKPEPSSANKKVIKQVNIKENTPNNTPSTPKNAPLFKYCTCGEPNTDTSIRCTSCGADIKGITPETKEEHQNRLRAIIDSAQSLKPTAPSDNKVNVQPVQPKVEVKEQKPLSKFIVSKDSLLSIRPTSDKWVVGRGLANGNQIESYLSNKSFVSRKHLQIWLSSQGVCVSDVGSTNGTYLNGKRIEANQKYILQVGDVLVLGKPGSSNVDIATFDVK